MASGTIKNSEEILLWTNPSPNANFAAQTISLSLSNYSKVKIVYGRPSSSDYYREIVVKVGYKTQLTNQWCNINGCGVNTRLTQVTPTSIIFNDNYNVEIDKTPRVVPTLVNNMNVPIEIYGIK